jgi:hypothetical protein
MKKLISHKYFVSCALMIAFFSIPSIMYAQPPGFGGGDDVLDVPLDGGLSVLLAAGIGYGAKKIKEKRKK